MFLGVGVKHWLVGGLALGWAKGSSNACPDLGARLALGRGIALWAVAEQAVGLLCGHLWDASETGLDKSKEWLTGKDSPIFGKRLASG
jgi:hypothetical protein